VPDHWALEQLFPIVPTSRLREAPEHKATLCDITCDSDGQIDHFVDIKDVKEVLPLHDPIPGEPYDLAFCLLGAYQDVMGDLHNLYGAPDEVHVTIDPEGRTKIDRIVPGDTVGEVLSVFHYEEDALVASVERQLAAQVEAGALPAADAVALVAEYRALFSRGTYLRQPT
jgi:arginine decarboxylase